MGQHETDAECTFDHFCLHLPREIHPLHSQPNRHSMLVPRVCAPRVTRFSLGRYWSCDLCIKQAAERLTGWLGIHTVILSRSDRLPRRWDHQAANPGVHRLSMAGSEIWWCMHSAHSLSTTLRLTIILRNIYSLKYYTDFAFRLVISVIYFWYCDIYLQAPAVGTETIPGAMDSQMPDFIPRFLEGQSGVTIQHVACGDLFTACLTGGWYYL